MDPDDRRIGVGVLAVIAISIIAAVAVWFGTTMFRKETADFRGSAAQTEQVRANAPYRIAAYDNFFNLCAGIQAKEGTLAALKAELSESPTPDRAAQLRSFITAVTASRRSDIATYNGDAAKTGTRAQFLSSTLPYTIDPAQEATTCVVR